jgi:hypothetical protein
MYKKLLALLLLSPLIFITSCGKSPEEKIEVATITCNILEASLDTDDASQRIKEINRVREELNEEAFLGKDDEITKAIKYNLCKELVLNDKLYEESSRNSNRGRKNCGGRSNRGSKDCS